MTLRHWTFAVVAGLAIAIVGGVVSTLSGDVVNGFVREARVANSEKRIGKLEARVEEVNARSAAEIKEAAEDRAALRKEVSTAMSAVLVGLGELRGEVKGLTKAVDRLTQ